MRIILTVIFMCCASASSAEELRFSVRGWGLPIGQLVLNARPSASVARGRFRTTGLAGAVAAVRFDMVREGPVYHAKLHTGRRARQDRVRLASGDNRLDPLTALWRALATRDQKAGCVMQSTVFDGVRQLSLTLAPVGDLRCRGHLTRISGYSRTEMAEAHNFPIEIWFKLSGGKMYVQKARVDTVHGQVTLIRVD